MFVSHCQNVVQLEETSKFLALTFNVMMSDIVCPIVMTFHQYRESEFHKLQDNVVFHRVNPFILEIRSADFVNLKLHCVSCRENS